MTLSDQLEQKTQQEAAARIRLREARQEWERLARELGQLRSLAADQAQQDRIAEARAEAEARCAGGECLTVRRSSL